MKSTRDYPFGSLGKNNCRKSKNITNFTSGRDSIVPENGIELAFNEYLQGVPGKEMNQEISEKFWSPKNQIKIFFPQPGKNVITTINIEFQDAELALKKSYMKQRLGMCCFDGGRNWRY